MTVCHVLGEGKNRKTGFPTPNFSFLSSVDFQHVYEPAEDTFLLMDALELDIDHIKAVKPSVVVEVGSGSGLVSTFFGQLLGPHVLYLCTDINENAANMTKLMGKHNNVSLNVVITDLVSGLSPRLNGQIDILMFNPPYVVTHTEEVGNGGIECSWAGGEYGREVMDRLLPLVSHLLSPNGIFYLEIIKENKREEIENIMRGHGFDMEIVLQRRTGPEKLSILKFSRMADEDDDLNNNSG